MMYNIEITMVILVTLYVIGNPFYVSEGELYVICVMQLTESVNSYALFPLNICNFGRVQNE